jgi:hypothetical protein
MIALRIRSSGELHRGQKRKSHAVEDDKIIGGQHERAIEAFAALVLTRTDRY